MTEKCTGERFDPPWPPKAPKEGTHQSWDPRAIVCERSDGHIGKHQQIMKTPDSPFPYKEITWDGKTATTRPCITSRYWNECDECSILIADDKTLCETCSSWERIWGMDTSEYIVVNGTLFLINHEATQIEREKITVLWFDESRPALSSSAVYRFAEIPWYYREVLPDNAQFKPKPSLNGGLFVPYGPTIQKEKVQEFLASYGRLE